MEDLVLRGYQGRMVDFGLVTPRCALWAEPGLGKTATALTLMCESLFDRLDTARWLVVAPKLVALDAWPRQFARWRQFEHLSFRNITARDFGLVADIDAATGRRKGLAFEDRGHKAWVKKALHGHRELVHLVSWNMLPWLVKAYGSTWPYDGLVLDESIFAANASTLQHRAAWHVIQSLQACTRVVELCGAPIPNGYEQLHGQLRLLDGGERLGKSLTDFRGMWMRPDKLDRSRGVVYRWKLAKGAKEEIDERVRDLCLSLRASDYLDLPELVVNPIFVTLPDAARSLYAGLERDLLATVGGRVVLAPSEAVLGLRLRQIANGAIYPGDGTYHEVHDAKLDRLVEIVEATEGPILLAFNFVHDWDRIVKRLGAKAAVHVRDHNALERFRQGKVKVLGMHPASGAHGLDGLQDVSSTAVWFGATYNADHWTQFAKRLHRDGQRAGRVTVHQLLADDTIENYVAGVPLDKLTEQDALMDAVQMRKQANG